MDASIDLQTGTPPFNLNLRYIELFPNLAAHAKSLDPDLAVDTESMESVVALAYWSVSTLFSIPRIPTIHAVARATLYDILALNDAKTFDKHCAFLLQYAVSMAGLHATDSTGRGALAVDWLVCSLNDPREDDQTGREIARIPTLRTDRLIDFLEENPNLSPTALGFILDWTAAAFRVAGKVAMFASEMEAAFSYLEPRLRAHEMDDRFAMALISLWGWASDHQIKLDPVDARLESLAFDRVRHDEVRKRALCVLLTTTGISGKRVRENALNLSETLPFCAEPLLKLQLMLVAGNKARSLTPKMRAKLLTALRELFTNERPWFSTGESFKFRRNDVMGLFYPVIVRAALEHQCDWVRDILLAGKEGSRPITEFTGVIDSSEHGLLVTGPQRTYSITRPTYKRLDLDCARNAFRGLPTSVFGSFDHPPQDIFRPDSADPSVTRDYGRFLDQGLRPEMLARALHAAKAQSLSFFPVTADPVQALLARTGHCWPINVSFDRPRRDRPLSKMLLVDTGSLEGVRETEFVREVLRDKVQIHSMSGVASTKRALLNEISRTEWDVVWIAGHSDYNYDQPDATKLIAGDDQSIGLLELLFKLPKITGRALLVLNVCDGAYTGNVGCSDGIGLAHSLASGSRAIVSNLWTVTPRFATLFGCLFAACLSHAPSFFAAFSQAIQVWCGPQQHYVDFIRPFSENAASVAEGVNPEDWDNLHRFGAPTFLQ